MTSTQIRTHLPQNRLVEALIKLRRRDIMILHNKITEYLSMRILIKIQEIHITLVHTI